MKADPSLELAGQIVVLQQDAVLERQMPGRHGGAEFHDLRREISEAVGGRLAGDTAREATSDEVKELKAEARQLLYYRWSRLPTQSWPWCRWTTFSAGSFNA